MADAVEGVARLPTTTVAEASTVIANRLSLIIDFSPVAVVMWAAFHPSLGINDAAAETEHRHDMFNAIQ